MRSTEQLAEVVAKYKPAPWIVVPGRVGDTEFGMVFSRDQNPETDAPIMIEDLDTCHLVVGLVNKAMQG